MSPNPRRGTPAGDATLQIRALARRTGRDVQDLTTLHVPESLLARVAASDSVSHAASTQRADQDCGIA